MTKRLLVRTALFGAAAVAPFAAAAQVWTPGMEITGQTVQVQTNGVVNSIYFGPNGSATVTTPSGMTVPASWSTANNMLCLSASGGSECWPYSQPFQAGVQTALTSNCAQVTTFMPQSVNPPVQRGAGERG